MTLAQKTLTGFIWTLTSRVGTRLSIFIVGIILARLLAPEDFGLVAMLGVFFAISESMVESGFNSALVREKEITESFKSTAFFINLSIAIILYVILWFSAPLIARFFDQPKLMWLTRFMGVSLIFNALCIVQRAGFTHALRFKLLAAINISVSIITGIVAVFFAYTGYGVWALAIKHVLSGALLAVVLFSVNPWLPKELISKKSFFHLFGFGSKLMLTGLLDNFFNQIYNLIIGRFFSPATLGYYNRASIFSGQFVQIALTPLFQVTYPILSKTKENPVRLKENFRKLVRSTSFVNFPMMALVGFAAEPIVLLLLGEKWAEVIPFLQVLSIGAIISHIASINGNLYRVLRRSDLVLLLSIINKAIIIIAIIIGLQFGIWGLMVGLVITQYTGFLISVIFTSKNFDYSVKEQLQDLTPVFLNLIPVVIILWFISLLRIETYWLNLLLMGGMGGGIYLLTAKFTNSLALTQIKEVIIPFFLKKHSDDS